MKLIGICTKPVSEVTGQLTKHKKKWIVVNKKEDIADDCFLICCNYFIFKKYVKQLCKTNATVLVFGNLLFLSEIVNINIIDIKQSSNNSAFISKPINYEELFINDFPIRTIKDYKHLDSTACLQDLRMKGKFGKLIFNCVNCTSVGENKTSFNRCLYSFLFNHQNIKELKKDFQIYTIDDYSIKAFNKLYKYLKTNTSFIEVTKFIGNQLKNHKPSNYAKLENKDLDIYKYNLKYMVKDYNMILDGKYNKVIG